MTEFQFYHAGGKGTSGLSGCLCGRLFDVAP